MKYIFAFLILFLIDITFVQFHFPSFLQRAWKMENKCSFEKWNIPKDNPLAMEQDSVYISLPQKENIAVSLDGISGLNEWDNSLKMVLEPDYNLYLIADKDWLYIGIFGENNLPYTDIYVKTAVGLINFHASMQLGERYLPENNRWNDETPGWDWGNNSNWSANTVKYIPGVAKNIPFREQLKAYEGQEFKIAIDKLGLEFSMLVVIRDFVDPAITVSFPANGNRYDTNSWKKISIHP